MGEYQRRCYRWRDYIVHECSNGKTALNLFRETCLLCGVELRYLLIAESIEQDLKTPPG